MVSLQEERPGISIQEAGHAALVELGDPDRLAPSYSGRALELIGPEVYPAYVRALKVLLLAAVPAATLVVAAIDAIAGDSIGAVVGGATWMAFIVATQVAFWVTFTFALFERGYGSTDVRRSLAAEWTPDQLPELPRGRRGSATELALGVAWLGFLGVAIVAQHFGLAVNDAGERLPLLDPGLWSFWLPLILVLLVIEMGSEVVQYRADRWTPRLATINGITGAAFAAPVIYLAATDRLLNPATVAVIQNGWPGFDAGTASSAVIVGALAIWAWNTFDGWRKTWTAQSG